MHSAAHPVLMLQPEPRSVRAARRHLHEVLTRAGLDDLVEPAALAISGVVTNALLHTATPVDLRVYTHDRALRVEVEDRGLNLPTRRSYAETSGTGRGLQLLEESVDQWGVTELADGKVVWFEIGHIPIEAQRRPAHSSPARPAPARARTPNHAQPGRPPADHRAPRRVTLRQVPLLMHLAWQEHAATLLREYLLHASGEIDDILDKHAKASQAMSLLAAQLPQPRLGDELDALVADAIEPNVTATEIVLDVPADSVPHFATLNDLLRDAIAEARAGRFLSPHTQPETDEMRHWLCTEVARQSAGDTTATPWVARTDVRATLADQADLTAAYASLAEVEEALLATDEASIIVAASPTGLRILGYHKADELLGRRVIVVVPSRFHQAHIAGTTMNATNGRDNLLAVPITVPMVRADNTEILVNIEVRPQLLHDDRRVFVAQFRVA